MKLPACRRIAARPVALLVAAAMLAPWIYTGSLARAEDALSLSEQVPQEVEENAADEEDASSDEGGASTGPTASQSPEDAAAAAEPPERPLYCPLAESAEEAPATEEDVLYPQASIPGIGSAINEKNALAILKAYDSDGYHMVSYTVNKGEASLATWLMGHSSNVDALDTVVHEECHGYTSSKGGYELSNNKLFWKEAIYIGSGKDIVVREATDVTVFPTEWMAKYIPENLRTFRYNTYVAEGAKPSANVNGPFGLLDEFNAYSWGMKNQLDLFEYYRSQGNTYDTWSSFVSNCASDTLAYAEFRYWTLRYLAYAKTYHPDVYNFFLSNQNYVNAYCITQARFESQIAEFKQRLDQIVTLLRASGQSARIEDNVLWIGYSGIGLVDEGYDLLMADMASLRFQDIDKALHAKQTVFKRSLSSASLSSVPSQAYSGKPLTPAVTVRVGSKTLKKGTDYVIGYVNNVNLGTATVFVAGRGDYVGMAQRQFEIVDYPFIDINGATPHLDDIIWLSDAGISTGYVNKDGTKSFKPMSVVYRQDMAAFLFRMALRAGVVTDEWQPTDEQMAAFTDVTPDTPHCREIWWLASAGISTGYDNGDGTWAFRPMGVVYRQDMAAFLYRLAALEGKATDERASFPDVTDETPHADEIRWLAAAGISQGYKESNGTYTFRGMNPVYRQDMAAFLHRLDSL